jgi:hypothetical protein
MIRIVEYLGTFEDDFGRETKEGQLWSGAGPQGVKTREGNQLSRYIRPDSVQYSLLLRTPYFHSVIFANSFNSFLSFSISSYSSTASILTFTFVSLARVFGRDSSAAFKLLQISLWLTAGAALMV